MDTVSLDKYTRPRTDLRDISLGEFLEDSMLTLLSGDALDMEVYIMHGGALCRMHCCVEAVTPPEDVMTLLGVKH